MADKKRPFVDYKKCMACRVCVVACPFGCLEMSKMGEDSYRKMYPELLRPESCTGCGICASSCPIGIITMVSTTPAGV